MSCCIIPHNLFKKQLVSCNDSMHVLGAVIIKLAYKFWLWKGTHLHSVNICAITWIPAMLCWFCCFFSWLERERFAFKTSRWTFKLQAWMNYWKNKNGRRLKLWWNRKQGYVELTSEIMDANTKQLCSMCSSAITTLAF